MLFEAALKYGDHSVTLISSLDSICGVSPLPLILMWYFADRFLARLVKRCFTAFLQDDYTEGLKGPDKSVRE